MWDKIKSLWSTPDLESFDHPLTRERLIQSGRLVVIDDESPLLISEMRQAGFAVDHDTDGSELGKLDNQIYDVAILDYHGVGQRLGPAQGLDMLKHIRRVSPRTRVIAFTSRSLSASESEFFRISHAVLPKDMGLGDSLTVVEGELQKALSKKHLFESLLQKLNITGDAEKVQLRKALAKSLTYNNQKKFKETVLILCGAASTKAAEMIIARLFGLG